MLRKTEPPTTGKDQKVFTELSLEELDLPEYLHDLEAIRVGGMGAILRGTHKDTGATLAIKVLLPSLLEDEIARKRFLHEAKNNSLLDHENVVKIFDYGVSDAETPYIVMEFIEGETLWQRIKDGAPLSNELFTEVFPQIIAGLEHAHSKGLVHRDLKPSNIMLSKDADGKTLVKVVDFGIAKFYRDDTVSGEQQTPLTLAGDVVGTPLFMSPEQCMAQTVDARSDIYAVGCMMYFALTGNLAVDGANAAEIFGKHCNGTVDLSALPESFLPVVRKCLEKEPIDRYQSMTRLLSDFRKVERWGSVRIFITGVWRKRFVRIGVACLGIVLGYAAGFYLMQLAESLF